MLPENLTKAIVVFARHPPIFSLQKFSKDIHSRNARMGVMTLGGLGSRSQVSWG
jgi:hypothetical protein